MNFNIYSILLIVIGSFGAIKAIKFLQNEEYARKYIESNPKAYLIKKIYGEEKAYNLTKKFFAPLGFCLSIVFFFLGIITLF